MSIMFSSSTTFPFTWRTEQRLTLVKKTLFTQVLVNTNEYFDRAYLVEYIVCRYSSATANCVTVVGSAHNTHTGVFFAGKRHVDSYCGLFMCHSTSWLHCLLSDVLQEFWRLQEQVQACSHTLHDRSLLSNQRESYQCVKDISFSELALELKIL